VVLTVALLFAPACATDTGNPSKDRAGRVTNAALKDIFLAALSFGASEGQSYLEGKNGQDAASAAFIAAGKGLISSGTFNDIVTAYAGPEVGQVAAAQFAKANPQTPADSAKVANTIGAAFQQAANQNNPPSPATNATSDGKVVKPLGANGRWKMENGKGAAIAFGGSVVGGNVLGGNVLGGNVLGGSVVGGNVLGGSVVGGSVHDGSVLGGSVVDSRQDLGARSEKEGVRPSFQNAPWRAALRELPALEIAK